MFRRSGLSLLSRSYSTTATASSVVKPKTHRLRNFLLYSTVLTGGLFALDYQFYESTGYRTLKAFYVLSRIGIDYKLKFDESHDISELHARSADRLLNLLNENKGLYIKLGQNIANQSSIFPKAFQEKFLALYDSAPTDPWEKVDGILRTELGDNYEELFEKIDRKPIASASIAQVHKGTLKNGEEVAIKVQHYYIAKQIEADIMTYKLFTKLYEYAFEIPVSFTTNYIAKHIREEVDFVNEMNNGRKVQQLVAEDSYLRGKIHIPKVSDLTTKRVLIAEWCEGEPLIRVEELKKKYDTKKIMQDYLELFSKMIFQWGFVHSDPHPGNLLVRYKPNGQQELVVLDHGLYVTLPEKVRYEYCSLWKSLFELDDKALKKIAVSWGIGEKQSDMFASFQLMKPYHKTANKMSSMTKFEREEMMKENFKNFFKETEKFPLELIFLGRTMRMVQLLNQKYRAPVNRINLFTKEAVKGFYLREPQTQSERGFWWRIQRGLRYTIFLMTMGISDVVFIYTTFSNRVFGTRNIEDVLQQKVAKEMKEMGIENPDNIDIFSG